MMTQGSLVVSLKYYGVSPWEIEVLYGILHDMFEVEQILETEMEEDYSTMMEVYFPLEFSDEFFKWFGNTRWDKVKGILREMKRRRGGGRTMKIHICFSGKPNIKFILDLDEHRWFNTAIEKIDFILELLQYQLDPQKIPQNITDIVYIFDMSTSRWRLNTGFSNDKKYAIIENDWKLVT